MGFLPNLSQTILYASLIPVYGLFIMYLVIKKQRSKDNSTAAEQIDITETHAAISNTNK